MSVPPSSPVSGPIRTCVGCRERTVRSDLLRLVVAAAATPSGASVVPDLRGRLPGRGAWIHPRRSCLDLATKRRAFARAFRHPGPFDLSSVDAALEDAAGTGTTIAPGAPAPPHRQERTGP